MPMIKVHKTFFRVIFFLLILGGFFGQSFASLLDKNGNTNSSTQEFRSPSKKSNYSPFLFFDSEEEFGENEDSLEEDEWNDGNSFSLYESISPTRFGLKYLGFISTHFRKTNGFLQTLYKLARRPLYEQFHQWKFDYCVNF